MVQFKNVFTGGEKRPYRRAVTAQKCLRVSGKHNDLENVGHTARHHTFFEMMGNFSFGDYFKEDAIAFAWEFLVDVIGLPKARLIATVFNEDDEAPSIWRKVAGFRDDEIVRMGEKDNFWSMGDTGPCGPCSEILIDQGESVGCGKPDCAPGCDCDRFLELWNLVFMQFDRDGQGRMTKLPRPSIDTGMGLERVAAVTQGVYSNWESDLFGPVIARIEALSGRERAGHNPDSIAIHVIADHSRAAAFLVSDGVLPSNEGRGYVLRRILRRALRYGKSIGLNEPFLFDAAGVVVNHMGDAYPDLRQHAALVEKVIRSEEERFLETLARGLVLFEEESGRLRAAGQRVLPGVVAFRLYDTYGFPFDLTQDMAAEAGLSVDQAGFTAEMDQQRARARAAWTAMQGEQAQAFTRLAGEGIAAEFTGYGSFEDSGTITAIIRQGESVTSVSAGDRVEVITDRTPFYGESGGQVGDQGAIAANGDFIDVDETVRPLADLIVHRGVVKSGEFCVGKIVELKVDAGRRRSIMANHSATHLLQWALRNVLGEHVKQSGSLVEDRRLRFDFTHFSQISEGELNRVEDLVNGKIRENEQVVARTMSFDEARSEGATALFGEKYGDTVRMISVGDFSKELCGGTHVLRTGDIGLFKVVAEGGIAAGVRRIEAVTGKAAIEHVRSLEREVSGIAGRLRASAGELVARLDKLIEEKKGQEREIAALKAKLASKSTGDILSGLREVSGVKVLAQAVEDVASPKDLRDYADRVRDRLGSGIALLGAKAADGKAMLIAVVTKDLVGKFHAGEIVKKAAAVMGGSGGGRPEMAQAGAPDCSKLQAALGAVEEFL
jgi:alanyl-tRNA synthetase